jgi:hypothetical protein
MDISSEFQSFMRAYHMQLVCIWRITSGFYTRQTITGDEALVLGNGQ